jgi:hypothetical protein
MSDKRETHRWLRPVLWVAGTLALLLGIIGIVVPGLPTTPFVLLAGACYMRASPRAHAWLLRNRTFGPILREWEQRHSVAPRVKRIALATMALTASFSIWFFAETPWLQGLVLGAMLVGATVVWRLPSRQD